MSSFIAGYMSKQKLIEILETLELKDLKGFNFTASVGDESNEYGQNVAFFAEQTAEQRRDKTPRYYFGNGKVYWTDGKITCGTKVAGEKELPPSVEELEGAGKKEEPKATTAAGSKAKGREKPKPDAKDDLPF